MKLRQSRLTQSRLAWIGLACIVAGLVCAASVVWACGAPKYPGYTALKLNVTEVPAPENASLLYATVAHGTYSVVVTTTGATTVTQRPSMPVTVPPDGVIDLRVAAEGVREYARAIEYARYGIYPATPTSYTCGYCGKRFTLPEMLRSCVVNHIPGTCCHYGQTQEGGDGDRESTGE